MSKTSWLNEMKFGLNIINATREQKEKIKT